MRQDAGNLSPWGSPRWPEAIHTYPSALRAAYREGRLFGRWREQYRGHYLFTERMAKSGQIPHGGPLKNAMFFHELYMGTRYLDAGYEALFFYRRVEDDRCYQMAEMLLGSPAAAQIITPNSERGGRPPDLLVFNPKTGAFRFVECKGRSEPFTPRQEGKFRFIERYLNETGTGRSDPLADPSRRDLFPDLSKGQWIHIARLVPASQTARRRAVNC